MSRHLVLSRRSALRVGSITVGLPFLEPMLARSASAQAAQAARRLVVLFKPNGSNTKELTPTATGTAFELPASLAPLAPLADRTLVVSGVHNDVAAPAVNLHLAGITALLSGVRPDGSKIAMTMDQVLAEAWRGQTALASLELGGNMSSGEFANNSGQICEELPCSTAWAMSYGSGGQRKPTEVSPRAAFERLFAGTPPPASAGAAAPATPPANQDFAKLRFYRKSILDHVSERTTALQKQLGRSDRLKLDAYLSAIRELEGRIDALPVGSAGTTGPGCVGTPAASKVDGNAAYPLRLEAMLDVVALALACDATRVVTFMMAEGESEYGFGVGSVPDGEGHHSTSHHERKAEKLARVAAIDRFYVEKVAYLGAKLASFEEASGSVLGSTILLHTAEMGDGDQHSYFDMPVVLVGGQDGLLPSARHVRVTKRPIADLYLTLFEALGVPQKSFGNAAVPLALDG